MIALILILIALVLWILANRAQHATGLPGGRVVYSDMGSWGRVEKPLYSARLGLTGKPDYLVNEGGRYVPVEVKSGHAPQGGAYPSHVYQLAAYCALVADTTGHRPSYGIIKYADKTIAVDYTTELESALRQVLDDIRQSAVADDVPRSHDVAAKCRACGFNEVCEENL